MKRLIKLLQCFFRWSFSAEEANLVGVYAVVTQGWSFLEDGSPGPGNALLAKTMRDIHERYPRVTLIASEEIAHVAPDLPWTHITRNGTSSFRKSSLSWNTHTIAADQARVCTQRGLKKIALVVCPVHMGRALWVYEKLGLLVVPAPVRSGGRFCREYCHKKAVHFSVRHPLLQWIREFFCRLLFWWHRYI